MSINYRECLYSLLVMSLTANIFLVGWIVFRPLPKHEHAHVHVHGPVVPKARHGGKIVKLGYDYKFWAEFVLSPELISVYLTDKHGKSTHSLITEVDLQQAESGVGVSHGLCKHDGCFILELVKVEKGAELRVCVEDKQYYGEL